MAISLAKGQKISLEKVAADAGVFGGLKKIHVGLGWDPCRYDGTEPFDLDVSLFLCADNGHVMKDTNMVFYNNKTAPGVVHQGDNRTGEGDGDDESVVITLAGVESDVAKIGVTVTIDRGVERNQNMGMVENAYIRVLDADSNTELLRYDLTEDYSSFTALIVADLYRHNGEWKFNPIGSGFMTQPGEEGLAGILKNYGLN